MSVSSPENIYPSHGHRPSYDTFTTGEGSYGTDTRGNSTDPVHGDLAFLLKRRFNQLWRFGGVGRGPASDPLSSLMGAAGDEGACLCSTAGV